MHSGVWYKVSLAARKAGVPRLLFTEHGRAQEERWLARALDRRAAARTDVVVAVSDAVAKRLQNGIVPPGTRLMVVENGVDTALHVPRADTGLLRAALGLAPEVPIIGSVGRLEQIKGYDVMIEAFALLRQTWAGGPSPVLVVGGDGSERDRCRQMAAARGMADAVFLLGWRDDIHDLHSAFTLFTMSSRSEGTSVSLLEAMSAGLCPVITDVGGNAVVLGPGLHHRLVPTESPRELAEAWKVALLDREARTRDGAIARQRVQERFSLAQMVRAYEELYSEA
jgi:glycosyltransferase involved in cell wall biosynthesis